MLGKTAGPRDSPRKLAGQCSGPGSVMSPPPNRKKLDPRGRTSSSAEGPWPSREKGRKAGTLWVHLQHAGRCSAEPLAWAQKEIRPEKNRNRFLAEGLRRDEKEARGKDQFPPPAIHPVLPESPSDRLNRAFSHRDEISPDGSDEVASRSGVKVTWRGRPRCLGRKK